MSAYALALPNSREEKYQQIVDYLSEDNGYWLKNDTWNSGDRVFSHYGLAATLQGSLKIHFTGFQSEYLKNEAKYFLIWEMKQKQLSPKTVFRNYKQPLKFLAEYTAECKSLESFCGMKFNKEEMECSLKSKGIYSGGTADDIYRYYRQFIQRILRFITDEYDERQGLERDVWKAVEIPGLKISAAEKSGTKRRMDFLKIPEYYRDMVKRVFCMMITRRSWSYCCEMLVYLKYFFCSFYSHGYVDGFLKRLNREDVENYLMWIMTDYKDNNATYRSKALSYIRTYLEYIQLAQHPLAPEIEMERLIFSEDYPKRERTCDTLEKVKYIPEPVKEQIDAAVYELESREMRSIYILLRESGWRGTDILNLRYGNCLDYQWNEREKKYVSYLQDEITKTGIPLHRIPIRDEIAEMVRELAEEAKQKSTPENNPDGYLFNTYEGQDQGMPLSKLEFVKEIRELIRKKDICDANGKLHHFKTHSLRHTRAMEYAEQGMPIGIIQQILGHCSLQMTLHYAKVSENVLYEKWKETEKLNLFHIEGSHKEDVCRKQPVRDSICYESVRKSLDAVRVPFGTCFKSVKVPCTHQMKHCLECASLCSTTENLPEFEAEIERVNGLIEISLKTDRSDWVEKNRSYLDILEKMLDRIRKEGVIHKNGKLREDG